jgi:hypothetical protein
MLFWYVWLASREGAEPQKLVNMCQRVKEEFANHPDDIQASLVQWAAAAVVAPHDGNLARAIAEGIAHPATAARARVNIARAEAPSAPEFVAAVGQLLDDLAEVVKPQHMVSVAAHAAHLAAGWDLEAARALVGRAIEHAEGIKDPLGAALGLLEIAPLTGAEQAAGLGRKALSRIREIGASSVLADVLSLAVATGDPTFVSDVLVEVIERGWTTFMASLENAAGPLLASCRPTIIGRIDAAMRAALRGVDGEKHESREAAHLDGVDIPIAARPRLWLTSAGSGDPV